MNYHLFQSGRCFSTICTVDIIVICASWLEKRQIHNNLIDNRTIIIFIEIFIMITSSCC